MTHVVRTAQVGKTPRKGRSHRKGANNACPSGLLPIKTAMRMAALIDSPYAKQFHDLGQRKDWLGLMKPGMPNPSAYSYAHEFREDWLLYNIIRKFPSFGVVTKQDRVDKAIAAFKAGERKCAMVNERLEGLKMASWTPSSVVGPQLPRSLPSKIGGIDVDSLILATQRNILNCVGPTVTLDTIYDNFRLSTGASALKPKLEGDPFYKLTPPFEVTPAALAFLPGILRTYPVLERDLWHTLGVDGDYYKLVAWDVIDTVPKNSGEERVIGKGAAISVGCQLALGTTLKKKYSSHGPNSLYQQESQQLLAHAGSLFGTVATVDFENASNSTCIASIDLLWPADWFDAFNATRSHYYRLPDGTVHRYNMLSPMGNGFTFEVLTITIWAIAKAVCDLLDVNIDGRLGVFGDDLAIPTEAAEAAIAACDFFGYTTNKTKTFIEGPFRESCGKHYFNGADVTPFYIDDNIRTREQKCWLANSIRRWSSAWCTMPFADSKWETVWGYVRGQIMGAYAIPDDGRDTGLMCSRAEAAKLKRGSVVPIQATKRVDGSAALTSWLMRARKRSGPAYAEGSRQNYTFIRSGRFRSLWVQDVIRCCDGSLVTSEIAALTERPKNVTIFDHGYEGWVWDWVDPPAWTNSVFSAVTA